MLTLGSVSLAIAAGLSASAAVAHIACVVIGPSAYRFMGAGEAMARAVEAGRLKPTIVTLAISAVLLVWAAYALSAAGFIDRLPLTKFVVLAITLVYLGRALAFPLLRPAFRRTQQGSGLFPLASALSLAPFTPMGWQHGGPHCEA